MGVIDLQHQAGVDDRPVLLPKCVGHGVDVLLLGRVVDVLALVGHTRRRDHRQERGDLVTRAAGGVDGGLDVGDVALQRVMAGVRDRADAHGIAHDVLESLRLVVLGVELGEALDVGARAERALRVGRRAVRVGAVLESVEPFEDVARPADRLAELAITDEIDPDLGLLPHDVAD